MRQGCFTMRLPVCRAGEATQWSAIHLSAGRLTSVVRPCQLSARRPLVTGDDGRGKAEARAWKWHDERDAVQTRLRTRQEALGLRTATSDTELITIWRLRLLLVPGPLLFCSPFFLCGTLWPASPSCAHASPVPRAVPPCRTRQELVKVRRPVVYHRRQEGGRSRPRADPDSRDPSTLFTLRPAVWRLRVLGLAVSYRTGWHKGLLFSGRNDKTSTGAVSATAAAAAAAATWSGRGRFCADRQRLASACLAPSSQTFDSACLAALDGQWCLPAATHPPHPPTADDIAVPTLRTSCPSAASTSPPTIADPSQ